MSLSSCIPHVSILHIFYSGGGYTYGGTREEWEGRGDRTGGVIGEGGKKRLDERGEERETDDVIQRPSTPPCTESSRLQRESLPEKRYGNSEDTVDGADY